MQISSALVPASCASQTRMRASEPVRSSKASWARESAALVCHKKSYKNLSNRTQNKAKKKNNKNCIEAYRNCQKMNKYKKNRRNNRNKRNKKKKNTWESEYKQLHQGWSWCLWISRAWDRECEGIQHDLFQVCRPPVASLLPSGDQARLHTCKKQSFLFISIAESLTTVRFFFFHFFLSSEHEGSDCLSIQLPVHHAHSVLGIPCMA